MALPGAYAARVIVLGAAAVVTMVILAHSTLARERDAPLATVGQMPPSSDVKM